MPEITAEWGLSASAGGLDRRHLFRRLRGLCADPRERHRQDRCALGVCRLLAARRRGEFRLCRYRAWLLDGARLAVPERRRARRCPHAGVEAPGWTAFRAGAGARGTAIYISSYALGSAGSFLLTGVVDAAFGWRASFTASGIAPLLAIAALALLPAASKSAAGQGRRPGFSSGVARPGVDGLRAGLCRQYLGGVRRPGLVCGVPRLDAQPSRQ